jgi:hypothetical protein
MFNYRRDISAFFLQILATVWQPTVIYGKQKENHTFG